MGAIGKWIDARCAEEPEVMRRVLNRKFGDLGFFIEEGGKCGCLVGSYGLVREDSWAEQRDGWAAPSSKMLRDIGYRVASLGGQLTSERRAVRIVKQRIRKAIGLAPTVHHEEEELACHS